MKSIHWGGLAFFLIVATVWSGAFRPGFLDFHNSPELPFLYRFALEAVLIGSGPAVAALLSWLLFGRQNRTSSLFGNWQAGALVLAVIPPSVLSAFGLPNDFGMNPHAAGGLVGGMIVLYALGEEIGWRGFMQDALAPIRFIPRSMMIGTTWWAWHLWFMQPGASVEQLAGSYVIIVAIAFVFSAIISVTRSWLSAAAFHALGNIAFFAGGLDMASSQRFMIAGVAFALMLLVHHRWTRRSGAAVSAATESSNLA